MQAMTIDPAWLQRQFPDLSGLNPIAPPGGQKLVFSAQHATEGSVVLKLVHLRTEPERIDREVDAVQQIQSSRVPQIKEVGKLQTTAGEVLWIREERIAGENLRQPISRGPLRSQQVLRLGLHALEALAAAERVRIVHRDVKPENLIAADDGSYYLLDFGIARHLDLAPLTTLRGWGMGTAGYAPPEQYRNLQSEIDARADLFALGVTLYEAIEGVNPFIYGARDPAEIVRRIEHQPLQRIGRQVDSANELPDLVFTMTRVRKDHRPRSVGEALQWMQEICTREGI